MSGQPFPAVQLPPGTTLADKYQLGDVIGAGRFSVVYTATHRYLDRIVAVKVLTLADDESERRFAREARLASSLDHPNIVAIYELGRLDDGRPFLVMELLDGDTVMDRLATHGAFPVAEALRVGRGVLAGLGAAHEKEILHRDLRPENVFLADVRGEPTVKLLDFGISWRFDDGADHGHASASEERVRPFLAPEQLDPDRTVDHRADLYAVGMLLYAMLAGAPPSPTTIRPPSEHREGLPADLDRVVLKAMAEKPEDRYATADEMGEALRVMELLAEYLEG